MGTTRKTTGVAAKAAAKPATKPVAKAAPKTAAKPAATKVKTAAKVAVKQAAAALVLRREDIELRAYFIGEARRAAGLPGDSTADWLRAEQELAAK